VVNCNLQRLDGPGAATGRSFRAGIGVSRREVDVIKVLWGVSGIRFWSAIRKDARQTMGELVDGEYQKLVVSSGLMSASISLGMIRGC